MEAELIVEIIKHAGRIALDHFLEVEPSWKADRTYVTEADLAVQEYVREALARHFPEDGIIAEENDLQAMPSSGTRIWVIDPIDGTASFSAGLPVWGVAIALLEAGEPVAGYFYAPVTGDLIHTTPAGRVVRNGEVREIRPPAPFHRETSLFIASRLHRYYTISGSYPGKLRNLASSAAHLGYVATGSADAALVERVYVWDIAAGAAMLRANGGAMKYLGGPMVDLASLLSGDPAPRPMLAGRPETIAAFEEIIQFHPGEP
jgi:myo-inositol-1(or 4)-monophosphatase